MAANKRDPISKQKIHAKAGLTRLAFNAHHPVLLIGDDRSAPDHDIGLCCRSSSILLMLI